MKLHFNTILLAQCLVLTTMGGFANDSKSITGSAFNTKLSVNGEDTSFTNKDNITKTVLTEKLISFNAAYMSHSIDLQWNFTHGNRYARFYIERSFDGIKFEKVGEVSAKDAATAQDYTYTDYVKPSVSRKNDLYYRLKQIDGSEHADFSKVLIVRMYNTRSVTAVSVTPDPAVNDIQVNVQLKEKSFVAITVKDDKGSQMMKQSARADLGANVFSLEGTSKLKPGTYQLEVIINSNERMTMQLVKG